MIADTNICAFLMVAPNLKILSEQSLIKLAERFGITPKTLALLITIAEKGGVYYEN